MICKQTCANIQVVHFAKPKNLEPNAFKKSQGLRKIAKPNYLQPKASKFARFPESGDKFANMATLACTRGVQDPDFGVQSGRIFGFFWIWIGYRFPFNRIRINQMKKNVAMQKILI